MCALARALIFFLCFVTGGPATTVAAYQDSGPESSTARSSEVELDLIRRLSSSQFSVRRAAFMSLWRQGETCLPLLRDAVTSSDIQIAQSAALLEALVQFDVFPAVDQDVKLITDFLAGPSAMTVTELCKRGHWLVAERVVAQNEELRREFIGPGGYYQISRILEYAIEDASIEQSWPLISILIDHRVAAWLSQKAGLPFKPRPGMTAEEIAEIAFYSGDVDTALAAKVGWRSKVPWVTRSARWSLLNNADLVADVTSEYVSPKAVAAVKAALLDYGDRPQAAREAWAELYNTVNTIESAQNANPASLETSQQVAIGKKLLDEAGGPDLGPVMFAMLCNGQVEAIEEYLKGVEPSHAFVFLLSSGKTSTAFELIGLKADLSNFEEWLETRIDEIVQQAGLQDSTKFAEAARVCGKLVGIGKADEAKLLLDALVGTIDITTEALRRSQRTTMQTALWELLSRRVANYDGRLLMRDALQANYRELPPQVRISVLESLYPELDQSAAVLLDTASRLPGVPGGSVPSPEAWQRLDDLWRVDREAFGEGVDKIVGDWLLRAINAAGEMRGLDDQAHQLARIAMEFGLADVALEIADAPSAGAGEHWADAAELFERQGRNEEAQKYWSTLRRYRNQQYFSREINALLRIGEFEEVEKLERYRWLAPLATTYQSGFAASYAIVARELREREEYAEAAEYAEPAFLLAPPYQFSINELAICADELEQSKRSADVRRANIVELLHCSSQAPQLLASIPQLYDYIGYLAFTVHKERLSRAVVSFQAGDIAAGMYHARVGRDILPQDIEVAVQCYPILKEHGHLAEADELLGWYVQTMTQHLEDWPDDATALNNLAWMYAKCDYELEDAMRLAKRAVQLVPSSAVYLDTLAEIQFRRGDLDAALESMRNCIKLDPRGSHYRDNLIRFRRAKNNAASEAILQ